MLVTNHLLSRKYYTTEPDPATVHLLVFCQRRCYFVFVCDNCYIRKD